MDPNQHVPILSLTDASAAEIVRIALENEGIACELENEHQAGLTGVLPVRILVRAADEKRARDVIAQHPHLEGA